MNLEIKELRKKDFNKAIEFTINGMNFNKYLENQFALKLYGRYFFYMEMERATNIIAAYIDDKLAGILMVDMKKQEKKYSSFWRKLYVKGFESLMKLIIKDGPNTYDKANAVMLKDYLKKNSPSGEICFLAADPKIKGKGIGTRLLNELKRLEQDKLVYLYTDSNCTYQFYEKKGFKRSEEKEIEMELGGKLVPLSCFLYSKQLI
ncbi:GNAT family N-acetyltransferase [Enterococcus villorum]|uniref:GNAT family N-acetyltransferase n=1 Tax=Enterococcus villorum TaxID=112904 RepID=UPI003F8A24F0